MSSAEKLANAVEPSDFSYALTLRRAAYHMAVDDMFLHGVSDESLQRQLTNDLLLRYLHEQVGLNGRLDPEQIRHLDENHGDRGTLLRYDADENYREMVHRRRGAFGKVIYFLETTSIWPLIKDDWK